MYILIYFQSLYPAYWSNPFDGRPQVYTFYLLTSIVSFLILIKNHTFIVLYVMDYNMTLNFGIVSYHIIFTFFPNGFQARPKFPFNVLAKVKTSSELYHKIYLFFTQWHETTIFQE